MPSAISTIWRTDLRSPSGPASHRLSARATPATRRNDAAEPAPASGSAIGTYVNRPPKLQLISTNPKSTTISRGWRRLASTPADEPDSGPSHGPSRVPPAPPPPPGPRARPPPPPAKEIAVTAPNTPPMPRLGAPSAPHPTRNRLHPHKRHE